MYNTVLKDGMTALQIAEEKGHKEIVTVLQRFTESDVKQTAGDDSSWYTVFVEVLVKCKL